MNGQTITDRIAALPAPARHLALIVAAGGLSWAATDVVPWLSGQTGYGVLLAGVLSAALATLTPLVQGYGLGNREETLTTDATGPVHIRVTGTGPTSEEIASRVLEALRARKESGQ